MNRIALKIWMFICVSLGLIGVSFSQVNTDVYVTQPVSLSVVTNPLNGTIFENQVGKALDISVTFIGVEEMSGASVTLDLDWANPDSPLLSSINLERSVTSFSGAQASVSHSFSGDYWRLDSTGNYSFSATCSGGSVTRVSGPVEVGVAYDHDGDPDTADVYDTETTYTTYVWSERSEFFTYSVPVNGMEPTSVITYPNDGDIFTPGKTITITADAHDGDGEITRVEFLLGNNFDTETGFETYSAVLDSDDEAPYSTTFTIPGEGEWKLSARAFDEHGNSGRSSIVSFFGSYDPVMEELTSAQLITPLSGSSVSVTNPITFQVDVQPSALRSFVSVDYYVDGYKVNSEPVVGEGVDSFFDYTWEEPYIGVVEVSARAQLNNGDYIDTLNVIDVSVNGVGSNPVVTISSPPGDNLVVGSDTQFTVQASDSQGLVQNIDLVVNGYIVESIGEAWANSPWTFDYKYHSQGRYDVWAFVEFSNGNKAISNILKYDLELGREPYVYVVSPVPGMQFLPGTELPILATTWDPNSLIEELKYFVNDTLIETATRAADGSFAPDPITFAYNFPFAGTYRIYVQATDESGVIAQSEVVQVVVRDLDSRIPKVVMSHPLPVGGGDAVNDVSVGSEMYLNAIATDNDGYISKVNFYINSQLVGSSSANYQDTFAAYFEPTTPGNYVMFAEAIDNSGNRMHSTPLLLNVFALEAQLPKIEILAFPDYYDSLEPGTEISVSAEVESGLVTVNQVNFFVDGVLVDAQDSADEGNPNVFTSSFKIYEPGTHLISARAIEIDPLGLTTDNWTISDPVGVRVNQPSGYRAFVSDVYLTIVGSIIPQTQLDDAVFALNSGQISQAQYVYSLMESDAFDSTLYALMGRYLLTGGWPTPNMLVNDEVAASNSLADYVEVMIPTFQSLYWENKPIPNGFSSDNDYKDFFKVLFRNKFGVDPSSAQVDRGVAQMKVYYYVEDFVAELVRDTDAIAFGSGTISTLLGLPNPPNSLLEDRAYTAALFCRLLKVQPTVEEVENLRALTRIQQIQTILDDQRF